MLALRGPPPEELAELRRQALEHSAVVRFLLSAVQLLVSVATFSGLLLLVGPRVVHATVPLAGGPSAALLMTALAVFLVLGAAVGAVAAASLNRRLGLLSQPALEYVLRRGPL